MCKEHAEAFFNYRQQSSTKMHNPIKSLTLNELKASLEQSSNDLSELKENSVYRWIAEDKNEIIFIMKKKSLLEDCVKTENEKIMQNETFIREIKKKIVQDISVLAKDLNLNHIF